MRHNFEKAKLLPREDHYGKEYSSRPCKTPGGFVLAVLVAVWVLFTLSVVAGEVKPYDESAFKEAMSAGKTVLLDFHADWCPVCKKQGPLIESLTQEDKLKDVVVLKANYDDEKTLEKQLKVSSQSTLIVFKGEKEVARATGVTDKDKIRELIEKGL